MSKTKYQEEIEIKAFLKEVEKKLPGWLKDDKFEVHEVLSELEEHIWDKAEELAGGGEISLVHVQNAIQSMGTPEHIGREYKKRGTPGLYVSKEWLPLYKKSMLGGFIGLVLINLIVFFVNIVRKPFGENVWGTLSGMYTSILPILCVITVIFVALSMEGFLPKDFADEIEKAKHRERGGQYEVKLDFVKAKFDSSFASGLKKHKTKPPINTKGLLGDAIWGLIWGFLMVAQPIESINAYFTPEFLGFVQLLGILGIAESVVKMLQVFAGVQKTGTQQLLLIGMIVIQIFYMIRFYEAIQSPEVLHMVVSWPVDPVSTIFKIIMWVSIVGTGIGCLEKLGKIGSYSSRLQRYNEYQERTHIVAQ